MKDDNDQYDEQLKDLQNQMDELNLLRRAYDDARKKAKHFEKLISEYNARLISTLFELTGTRSKLQDVIAAQIPTTKEPK